MAELSSTSVPQSVSGTVVLAHGWGSNPLFMALLARRLRLLGYRTVNWGYWSLGQTIEHHGENLNRLLHRVAGDEACGELFLVTHSMGGIVARHALTLERPARLRRMVMLAPPNRGSRWANWLGPVIRPFCRTLDQLATRHDSFVNRLPDLDGIEFGVIAAGLDLLVLPEHTQLPSMRDFCTVPYAIHSGVLFRRSVVEQVDSFLRTGRFLPSPARAI